MKRVSVSKLIISVLLLVCLLAPLTIHAEGLLPGLSETVGIGMPSLGEALQCYPDSETENEDGSVTELFANVSESEFNTFSVYLEAQGASLANYQVENGLLTAEIQAKGASFRLSYNSRSGEAKVLYPSGVFDEWEKSAKTHLEAGQKLLEEGKTDEALTEFLAIPQYSEYAPVANLMHSNDNLAAATAAREARLMPYRTIGNTVVLGLYEQDNNTANAPEAIEWIVLDYDEKEDKALLLSKYGLDAKPYNTEEKAYITWEECTLRNWLNSKFLKSAFSTDEQAAILMTTVDNSYSQGYREYRRNGGNNTQDQIFLLSYAEVNRYLNVTGNDYENKNARVAPTAYASAQEGAWTSDKYQTSDGEPAAPWWLRSPGYTQDDAALVDPDGAVSFTRVYWPSVARPAFWINLKSGIF